MKKGSLYLIVTALFFLGNAWSQDLESVDSSLDEAKRNKSRLATQFAKVATGNIFSAPGNYAAISTTDKTLSASMFFLNKKDGNVINIEVSGGATQKISAIFDEGKLNSNVTIGASYNIMLRKANNAIITNRTAEDVIRLAIENENRKYQKRVLAVLRDDYTVGLDKDIQSAKRTKLALKVKKQKAEIDLWVLRWLHADIQKIQDVKKQRETLVSQLDELNYLIKELKSRKSKVDMDMYDELILAYDVERYVKVDELKNKIINSKPDGVSFSWITIGYKATNSAFALFDDSMPLDMQIHETDYTSHSLSLSYTHLDNAKVTRDSDGKITDFDLRKRQYVSFGAKFDYTNNLSLLKQVEIIDTEVVDEDSGRTKQVKQNAFIGDYVEELSNLAVFIDYYNFLSIKEAFAIHLNPVMLFRENFKPVASFQVGVVLPFKDKEKQSTTVNLEVFYKIKDVFNTTDNDNALFNRNIIGIQASFPFNF